MTELWPRVHMSFCLSSTFPAIDCFFCLLDATFSYFLFCLHFLAFSVLPNVLSHMSPSKIPLSLLSILPPAYFLSQPSIPFLPVYFTFLLFCTSHMFVPHFPSQIPHELVLVFPTAFFFSLPSIPLVPIYFTFLLFCTSHIMFVPHFLSQISPELARDLSFNLHVLPFTSLYLFRSRTSLNCGLYVD